MNIEQIRYFQQVCESQSLNKAADKLFISQPALTRSIHAMEKELGTILLIRDKKGVIPTEAGAMVLKSFSQMLTLYDEVIDKINNGRTFEQPLTIYTVPALSNACSADLIAQLSSKFCYLDIYFEEIMPRDLTKLYTNPISLALTISHNRYARSIDNLTDLTTIDICNDLIYSFAKKTPHFSSDYIAINKSKNNIAFRDYSNADSAFAKKNIAVFCNNIDLNKEYILNKNYIHNLPRALGKLLYSHPNIEGYPTNPSHTVSYKLVTSSSLLTTQYRFVIEEVVNILQRILHQ